MYRRMHMHLTHMHACTHLPLPLGRPLLVYMLGDGQGERGASPPLKYTLVITQVRGQPKTKRVPLVHTLVGHFTVVR